MPTEAMQVAQAFVHELDAQRFPQAFELTAKRGYVGQTQDEFQRISSREFCRADRLAYVLPFQSNGNRLRRLLTGKEVDVPQVTVEFTGLCLLSVVVRKTDSNTWRVVRFARHAG